MAAPPSEPTLPFGMLSGRVKDNLYLMSCGTLFTSPWVVTEATVRRAATIILTARRKPFELAVAGTRNTYQALAIKPLTERSIRAQDVRLISIQISPAHTHYRAFRAIRSPGVLMLDRSAFARFDAALDDAYLGRLTAEEGYELYKNVIATALSFMPKLKPADPRVTRATELLKGNLNYPLDELAAAVGLSYGRMSRLFAENVGISLRSYQLFQKMHHALLLLPTDRTLTDIAYSSGFTDLAHLSRVFQHAFGAPLSYFLNRDYVRVFMHSQLASNYPASEQEYSPARRLKKWIAPQT